MKQELCTINQAGGTTFTLQLPTASGLVPLACFEIVRCLPGKRLACLAEWQGRTVFAKLFVNRRRAKVHWQREIKGCRTLLDRSIPSPSLVYSGRLLNDEGYVLLFEYIPDARSALECWQMESDAERLDLRFKLTDVLAGHHSQGIVQNDLHLDNFLCAQSQIYTLDGADIDSVSKPLVKKTALKNLALFLAQLPANDEQSVDAIYRHYCAARGWVDTSRDCEHLHTYLRQKQQLRKQHLFKRIFRECRDFSCCSSWRNFTVYDKAYDSPALKTLLKDPDRAMTSGEPLKLGNTATVVRVEIDDRTFVIKRYNIKNRRHALNRAFRPTRAAVSWRNAHRLLFYGIGTPRPIALMERRFGPIRSTAYFITEYVADVDCRAFFTESAAEDGHKARIANGVATLLKKLHRHNICHGDLKATNFLIGDDSVFLIDLDAMKEYRFFFRFERCRHRDMKRFFKNWEANPAVSALFRRLLEAYC
jgi:tRNA A-37 threonylcarbamoyl transferase component Bud32